ncbi:conjugal transfer protein TraM [Bradyrhizobium sp. Arg68]|uniref:conjugal transfer protein TraM n=1 Tax=Bradyrhizobium ivorense TaxID=2511166 RepID=UPI001E327DC8|nr:conjugal transfer protein TraM [Bradyrhizobium ivorense]MCC8940332.1 conjugal transfer protein TraM [Bradyrhizobium ivorense]
MTITLDEIRKEVAIKHNVLLDGNDPILVVVTLNELVLGRYIDLASENYAEANKLLAVTIQQQVEASKETAGKIITDAATYVRDQVRQAVQTSLDDAAARFRANMADVQAAARAADDNRSAAHVAKSGAVIAAIVAGAAALIAVAALVIVLVK